MLEAIHGIGRLSVTRSSSSTCSNDDIHIELSLPGRQNLFTVSQDTQQAVLMMMMLATWLQGCFN